MGFDAGKKVVGRKRHVLTDTLGLLLAVAVHPASVQDRDGAEIVLREARRSFPFIERLVADAGYQGRKVEAAVARTGTWVLEIVRRCDQYRFVVLPKRWIVERTIKSGALVEQLHAATAAEAVASVFAKIKKLVNPKNPDVGCAPQVTRFLKAGDAICRLIIQRFQISTEADPVESVREFVRVGVPSAAQDDLTAAAVGMARDRVDKMIRDGQIAVLSAANFRRHFQTFARRSNLTNMLTSRAPEPSDSAIQMLVGTAPTFVRQLQIIRASDDMLITAVSDYLRTMADKVLWADEGIIVEESLDDLDSQLVRQHKIIRDEIEDTQAANDELARGRAVYRKCAATTMPLDGQALPSHFLAGAFNCLAELRRVGWHPSYLSLFSEE